MIWLIRNFFIDNDFLEIETPCRIPAPAPEANITPQTSGNWFLQTSPELYMKMFLAAGYERVFQICKCFRQKERGARHLPEFTMLEWYCGDSNYFDLMRQCEDLIRFVAGKTGCSNFMVYQGEKINLNSPWDKMSVSYAFDKFASMSVAKALSQNCFDEVMAFEIEPNLGHHKPVFLYDYPAAAGALARLKPGDNLVAERFELYIGGLELCNGFSELTDSDEQQLRFEKEQQIRKKAGALTFPMPVKFLEALQDMPEASGNALGIDRLVMLFTDTKKIDEVVAFTPEEL